MNARVKDIVLNDDGSVKELKLTNGRTSCTQDGAPCSNVPCRLTSAPCCHCVQSQARR